MTSIQRDPKNFDLVYDNYVALLADADSLRTRVDELEDQIKREGRMIVAQQGLREVLRVEMDQLRKALESANEICRSAFSIADRDGQTTNWQAFRARTKESLALQHRVLFPEQ